MTISPVTHRRLNVVRRHVLEDLWEIVKSKNMVEPLIASQSLNWVRSDAKQASLFLRMQLSRHMILVLTRINASPGGGKTGETACITAVLDEAARLGIISDEIRSQFLERLSQMKLDIANQGTSFGDLINFRNSELAHSLYNLKVGNNGLSYFVISQFSESTLQLISDVETYLISRGCEPIADIDNFEKAWVKIGSDFWEILAV